MTLLGVKVCLPLLWGMSVLFSTETRSASIPESSSSSNSTAEPNVATGPQTETQPPTWDPTRKPAEVTAATTAKTMVSPAVETQETAVSQRGDNSESSTVSLVVVNTAAPAPSSSGPRSLLPASTAARDAQPSHDVTETAKPREGQLQQQQSTTSTDTTAPATTYSPRSATEVVISPQPMSVTNPDVTADLSSSITSDHSTPSSISSASASAAAIVTTNPTRGAAPAIDPTCLPSQTSTTVAELSPKSQPTSDTNGDVTAELSSSTASNHLTQAPPSISSASASTAMTMNPTHDAAPASDPSSLPSQTSSTGAEISSTSQPESDTKTFISMSQFPDTTGLTSITESPTTAPSNDPSVSTSGVPTGSAGTVIPLIPRRFPVPATRSTPANATLPREASQNPPGAEVQPCSTRGVVKQCLIAVASLGGLATIFMVSTIALCAKMSARKFKVRRPQPATELMCISTLLPERTHTYTRQYDPVTNGVLVYPSCADSDDDGGDDLTLRSFLPENA